MRIKKGKSKLQIAQEEAEKSIIKTNATIDELGKHTQELYTALNALQEYFDRIRNIPSEQKKRAEQAQQICSGWKQQAEKIEKDFEKANKKTVGGVAAGVGVGVAVVTMAPTAAMGIATTFGVASTGTAISSLSGAAATNAALAWLGGGALATGGGGMAAGQAILALAGPIGWSIAGISLLASGIMFWKNLKDKKKMEELFTLISQRDVKSYDLAIVELNERISRIENETELLHQAFERIQTYGYDYSAMTEVQQYELGSYVNLVSSSTQLLVNPINGLQPKYTEEDYEKFLSIMYMEGYPQEYSKDKTIIIFLANLLYQIPMDEKDKMLLGKSIRSNKKLLESLNTCKKEFDVEYIDLAIRALEFKYI